MFGSSKKICSCFFSLFDVCSLIRNITIHQGTKKNVIPFSSFLIFFFFSKSVDGFSFHSFHVHYMRDRKTIFPNQNLQVLYCSTIFLIYFVFVTNNLKYCLIFDIDNLL